MKVLCCDDRRTEVQKLIFFFIHEGIPMTSPHFWADPEVCSDEVLRHVFRSATEEEMPMLKERIECLREAGEVLCEVFLPVVLPLLRAPLADRSRDMTVNSPT
jgi:hypothetical protein